MATSSNFQLACGHYPVKVSQNCFYSFNCSNQTDMQVSKFSFAPDNYKN